MLINTNRFNGIQPFDKKVWLASPTMHGEEQYWVDDSIRSNWVSTVGQNINKIEQTCSEMIGRKYSVALASGTSALHLAIRLCGEKLYGTPRTGHGVFEGHKVFASDVTFDATVNPIAYEGGEAIFIDSEYDSWNMDPSALEKAFESFPDVRLVVLAHLYGTPAKMNEILNICRKHNAYIVEDSAESFGSTYNGIQTGMFGDVSIISFNGNKIITGSSGGMLLTDNKEDADKIRKWSTQSRENAPWYQHKELGYNYRMSNIIAGVVRGQLPYLEDHIASKRSIYYRYMKGLADLPIKMNPFDLNVCSPNYWLSCLTIDKKYMSRQIRNDSESSYSVESAKSCPTEILETLAYFNAEGRPIWKPMHMQPIYRKNQLVTKDGVYKNNSEDKSVGADIFERGLCLPSDNKMTIEQQDIIIDIIHRCFI